MYVGQIGEKRGLDTLVTAFAQTVGQRDDWSLVFAGEGNERGAVRARIDRLGINRACTGSDRRARRNSGDERSTLLGVPALDDTVRGRNIPRSMACGLPVLASDLPSMRLLCRTM